MRLWQRTKYRYLGRVEITAYACFAIVFLRALLIYLSTPISHHKYLDFLNGLPVALSSWIRGLFMLQIHGPAGETAIYMFLSSFLPGFVCGLVLCATDNVKHPERFKQKGIVDLFAIMAATLGATIFIGYAFYDVAPGTAKGSRMYLNFFSPAFAVTTPLVIGTFVFGAILSAFHLTLKIFAQRAKS